MDSSSVEPVLGCHAQLESVHDPNSPSTLEEALLDLGDASSPGVGSIDAQVTEDVVMLGVILSEEGIQSLGGFLAAGDEAGLFSIEFETLLSQLSLQSSEGQDRLPCSVVRIRAFDVEGDIVHPCLQNDGRVFKNKGTKWPEEHQFGYCRGLWTALEDALLIVLGITSNALCLDQPGARVEVQSKLEVKRGVVQLHGGLDEMIQLHRVVEAGEVSKAGDGMNALMLANLSFERATNCNGEAVLMWSCMIPWHVHVQAELPFVKIVLAVAVPKPVDARGESDRSLNALALGDHDDVGVPQLKR